MLCVHETLNSASTTKKPKQREDVIPKCHLDLPVFQPHAEENGEEKGRNSLDLRQVQLRHSISSACLPRFCGFFCRFMRSWTDEEIELADTVVNEAYIDK